MPAKLVPVMPPSNLAQMAREVQAQISSARDRLAETRARLNSVLAEREKVLSAPTNPDDVRGILIASLKERALEARLEVSALIAEVSTKAAAANVAHPGQAALFGAPTGKVAWDMLLSMMDVERVADSMLALATVQPTEGGLTVDARRAKVAELDGQADLLRSEIAELSQALRDAGVVVDVDKAA